MTQMSVADAGALDDASWLWDRMMLCAPPRERGATRTVIPVPPDLEPALRLFALAAAGSLTGGPSSPSAGALYPYEHYVVTTAAEGLTVFALDVAARTGRLLRSGPAVETAVKDAGLGPLPAGTSLVLTVVRPWSSMRKYGDRGYLYAQLDAAHVTVHLLGLAAGSSPGAGLRTALATGSLARLLELDSDCRFVHSVLVLPGPRGEDPQPSPGDSNAWCCVDSRQEALGRAGAPLLQSERWRSLTSYRVTQAVPLEAVEDGEGISRRPLLYSTMAPLAGSLSDLATVSARRRSAKDFAPVALSEGKLEQALAAMRTPLAIDLDGQSPVSVTLVARHVSGWAPGSYAVSRPHTSTPGRHPRAAAPQDDELVRACMGQQHLGPAAAVVLLHASRQQLLGVGARSMDQSLLRAGALGHLLYLGATAAGVAVTAVGGFDAARWSDLAHLPAGDEVLYLLLLGSPGAATVKIDRLYPAYAHAER